MHGLINVFTVYKFIFLKKQFWCKAVMISYVDYVTRYCRLRAALIDHAHKFLIIRYTLFPLKFAPL